MPKPKPAAPQSSSSPLPWKFSDRNSYRLLGADGSPVAEFTNHEDMGLARRRVNQGPAFDAMLSALSSWLLDRADGVTRHETAAQMAHALKLAQEVK